MNQCNEKNYTETEDTINQQWNLGITKDQETDRFVRYITRFRFIEILSIYFTVTDVKKIASHIKEFVIQRFVISRFHSAVVNNNGKIQAFVSGCR